MYLIDLRRILGSMHESLENQIKLNIPTEEGQLQTFRLCIIITKSQLDFTVKVITLLLDTYHNGNAIAPLKAALLIHETNLKNLTILINQFKASK